MNQDTLIYGITLLIILKEHEDISFQELEQISEIKGEELRELLKYLKDEKEFVVWKTPVSISFIGADGNFTGNKMDKDKIKLSSKGIEVNIGKRDYFEGGMKSPVHNETHINGNRNQVAQSTGENSLISQVQDNLKINVLKWIIEEDKELDTSKKGKLLLLLENFNTLKESSENALELIKQVGQISIKYLSFFFNLLN
ncbi:Uncharacterised protein [uncultured archaeon]|nr:Uncharacterised protein [uncultured archaeon]